MKHKAMIFENTGCFGCHLGQTVDVSLIDELVVRGGGAALVDAEEVLLGYIYETV